MAKKSARNSNDYRKLQNMLKDLKKLKQELLPGTQHAQHSKARAEQRLAAGARGGVDRFSTLTCGCDLSVCAARAHPLLLRLLPSRSPAAVSSCLRCRWCVPARCSPHPCFARCADEKDIAQAAEMEKFDDFQRKKHELNTLLVDIRTDVERLNEMRKKLGEDGRDNVSTAETAAVGD